MRASAASTQEIDGRRAEHAPVGMRWRIDSFPVTFLHLAKKFRVVFGCGQWPREEIETGRGDIRQSRCHIDEHNNTPSPRWHLMIIDSGSRSRARLISLTESSDRPVNSR